MDEKARPDSAVEANIGDATVVGTRLGLGASPPRNYDLEWIGLLGVETVAKIFGK